MNARSPPIVVDMEVNGRSINTEVDTGAAVSIISEEVKWQQLPFVPLQKSDVILQTYTSENLVVLGKCWVTAKYRDQSKKVECLSFGVVVHVY